MRRIKERDAEWACLAFHELNRSFLCYNIKRKLIEAPARIPSRSVHGSGGESRKRLERRNRRRRGDGRGLCDTRRLVWRTATFRSDRAENVLMAEQAGIADLHLSVFLQGTQWK